MHGINRSLLARIGGICLCLCFLTLIGVQDAKSG